ncbi:MAG: hypothetical protein PHX62_08380, partial [Bacilli bacterium]|nr:hypothetical protein [Bacilli bacterium]
YQRYNCHKDEFREARIKSLTNILIIEGVFSANLLLRKYYQAIIYFEISEEEQLRRLQIRSHKLLPQFENKWLPRERRYFLKENVYSAADLIV